MPAPDLNFELEDDIFWVTSAVLPSWKGFQTRQGAYGAKSSSKPSDGVVRIVFAPEGRGTEPLNDFEKFTVAWTLENEATLTQALLDSLLKSYPTLQEQYGYSDAEKKQYMPDVHSVDEFRDLIGLHTVHVHPLQKDGIPYVGFEIGCSWDPEHGLGILMLNTRAIDIGGADTAFLLWIAERDANES